MAICATRSMDHRASGNRIERPRFWLVTARRTFPPFQRLKRVRIDYTEKRATRKDLFALIFMAALFSLIAVTLRDKLMPRPLEIERLTTAVPSQAELTQRK